MGHLHSLSNRISSKVFIQINPRGLEASFMLIICQLMSIVDMIGGYWKVFGRYLEGIGSVGKLHRTLHCCIQIASMRKCSRLTKVWTSSRRAWPDVADFMRRTVGQHDGHVMSHDVLLIFWSTSRA